MRLKKIQASVEAILFANAEPISYKRIARVLKIDDDTVMKILNLIKERLEVEESGIRLIKLNNKYQLCTKTEYADAIKYSMELKNNTPLSQAALEVMAIVAYNQPVTRAFVEQVRGVDSSGVMAGLVSKDLIEEKGRLEIPGKPLTYGTTDTFLRCFQISSIHELPQVNSLSGPSEEVDS